MEYLSAFKDTSRIATEEINSHKRKQAQVDEEEEEKENENQTQNQGIFARINKRFRSSIEEETKKKSDCGYIDSDKSAPELSVTHDSGFISADEMTPTRVRSDTMTGEESKFCKTSESSFRQDTREELKLKIKLYDKVYDYGTMGNESICKMVGRMLGEVVHNRLPNVNRMLFKTLSDDCHLNLALPTGALKRDVMYECIFMGSSNTNTTDFVRAYSVTNFHDDWHINSFDVKFESKVNVSYMQTLQNVTKLRVHFFPEETIYEALCRDGRFDKSNSKGDPVICSCDFISVDGKHNVLLSAKAIEYKGQCFMLKKRFKKNQTLPANVPPREMPGHMALKVIPKNVKGEPVTPIKPSGELALEAVFQPSAFSTPAAPSLQVRKLQTFEDLKLYLEEDFGLKLEPERGAKKEVQRNRKIEKFLKEHCQNFALDFPHTFDFSDLEHAVKLKFSVGTVIAVNVSRVQLCIGTCFRIGKRYVLTNYHVFEEVTNFAGRLLRDSFVDFNYKGTEEGYAVNFIDIPLLFHSKELDYAIMELDTMCDLPDSFTDLGYSIAPPTRQLKAGENLSLIGHPNGMGKKVNMSCPIKPSKQIESHLNLAVHVLDKKEFDFHHQLVSEACSNPNTAIYDVSHFFWGSSGSPGILINEKLLTVLHCRGIVLRGKHILEQGVLMSSIVEDVIKRMDGNDGCSHLNIDYIFGEGTEANFKHQPIAMETN